MTKCWCPCAQNTNIYIYKHNLRSLYALHCHRWVPCLAKSSAYIFWLFRRGGQRLSKLFPQTATQSKSVVIDGEQNPQDPCMVYLSAWMVDFYSKWDVMGNPIILIFHVQKNTENHRRMCINSKLFSGTTAAPLAPRPPTVPTHSYSRQWRPEKPWLEKHTAVNDNYQVIQSDFFIPYLEVT